MADLDSGPCGVCIGSDDGDPSVFHTEEIRKARKPHKCCECGDVIPKGASYEHVVGKWYDSIDTYRTCLPCREIRRALCCDGWTYSMLWEDAQEAFEHLTTGCLEQLTTAAAKSKLLEQWRAWKGL